MSAAGRHELILGLLEANGRVSVADVSQRAEVSEVTIRRDLEALERQRVLVRVHGGAMPVPLRSHEPPFAARQLRHPEIKQRIGRLVADLIEPGETIVLDSGTTTIEVARALKGRQDLRVMALSLHIAVELVDEPGIELMLPGGVARPGEHALSGSLALAGLDQLSFDTTVLTIAGLTAAEGLTEYRLDDADIKRAAFSGARRRIGVTDSTKLGRVAFAQVAPACDLDILVTDTNAPPELLEELRATGMDVRLVDA